MSGINKIGSENQLRLILKIPAYITSPISVKGKSNGKLNFTEMIDLVVDAVEKYNDSVEKIEIVKKNKAQSKQIKSINYYKSNYGDMPVILLQISDFKTGMIDGYLEASERHNISNSDKLGSDTNFVLLYPQIVGDDNFSHYFLIFIYEDPGKENNEISSSVRQVLSKVLKLPMANIKLPKVLEEIKKAKVIDNINLNLYSSYNDNNSDMKLNKYVISSVTKIQKTITYANVPAEEITNLIEEPLSADNKKKVLRFSSGENKEVKITTEQKEDALNKISETVEELFNYEVEISKTDPIYEVDFILKQIRPVVDKYLQNK